MIPKIGDSISIYFKIGSKIDGEVHKWSDEEIILQSGSSYIVIPNISDNILLYKFSSVSKDYNIIKSKTEKTTEDIKHLADLKKELIELEKEEISAKLNSHTAAPTTGQSYGLPDFSKIKTTSKHTRKEVASKNITFGTGLQDLFSKKY